MQEDTFHPTQTVVEAVVFQAIMRLDSAIPYERKLTVAQELIAMAGLKGKVRYSMPDQIHLIDSRRESGSRLRTESIIITYG